MSGEIPLTDKVPGPFRQLDPEKVSASFRQLEEAANRLNAVSDELGKSIVALDAELKRLNLGVTTWVTVRADNPSPDGAWYAEQLGYAKVGSKWGIALRTGHGYDHSPEDDSFEEWLFNDAPRVLRTYAIDKLPSLLDALVKAATLVAEEIKDRTGQAQQVVVDVKRVTAEGQGVHPGRAAAALGSAPKQRK